MKKSQRTIGPVQLLAIGFEPGFKFDGKILDEFQKLEDGGTLRIIDLLFVKKDDDNSGLIALGWQGEELGSIVGALLGFEFEESDLPNEKTKSTEETYSFGLTREQIENVGRDLPAGTAAGIVLIEHIWARGLKKAIRDAGGHPIAEGFLTPEAFAAVGNELMALTSAMNEEEKESKHEHRQQRPQMTN